MLPSSWSVHLIGLKVYWTPRWLIHSQPLRFLVTGLQTASRPWAALTVRASLMEPSKSRKDMSCQNWALNQKGTEHYALNVWWTSPSYSLRNETNELSDSCHNSPTFNLLLCNESTYCLNFYIPQPGGRTDHMLSLHPITEPTLTSLLTTSPGSIKGISNELASRPPPQSTQKSHGYVQKTSMSRLSGNKSSKRHLENSGKLNSVMQNCKNVSTVFFGL